MAALDEWPLLASVAVGGRIAWDVWSTLHLDIADSYCSPRIKINIKSIIISDGGSKPGKNYVFGL